MGTLEKIQAVQARLAASYALHFDQLLPEEDRAYRSLLNKLSTLSDFLKLAESLAVGVADPLTRN